MAPDGPSDDSHTVVLGDELVHGVGDHLPISHQVFEIGANAGLAAPACRKGYFRRTVRQGAETDIVRNDVHPAFAIAALGMNPLGIGFAENGNMIVMGCH
jgi:hypothetical protein